LGEGNADLEARLFESCYQSSHKGGILISARLDDVTLEYLDRKGRVLLLANSDDALPQEFGLATKLRAGCELDGRWFSNYNWIRSDRPPFRDIAFGRILGFESANIVPEYVVQGLASEYFEDVLAAATFGWLQKTSPLLMQARVGNGRLLLTTFKFQQYSVDAYATALLNSVLQYMNSAEFSPRLELTRAAETAQ
jgi:hypothetical protein